MKTSEKMKELEKEYLSEFCVIDGLNQHPTGYNFNNWLKYVKKIEKINQSKEKNYKLQTVKIKGKYVEVSRYEKNNETYTMNEWDEKIYTELYSVYYYNEKGFADWNADFQNKNDAVLYCEMMNNNYNK